jgi:hypothetical protein
MDLSIAFTPREGVLSGQPASKSLPLAGEKRFTQLSQRAHPLYRPLSKAQNPKESLIN